MHGHCEGDQLNVFLLHNASECATNYHHGQTTPEGKHRALCTVKL